MKAGIDGAATKAGLSNLLAQATRKDPPQRLAGKLALTRRLYQRGWAKPEVLNLYEFIDWLLALLETLEDAFLDKVHELEESTNMRYISAEYSGLRQLQCSFNAQWQVAFAVAHHEFHYRQHLR